MDFWGESLLNGRVKNANILSQDERLNNNKNDWDHFRGGFKFHNPAVLNGKTQWGFHLSLEQTETVMFLFFRPFAVSLH